VEQPDAKASAQTISPAKGTAVVAAVAEPQAADGQRPEAPPILVAPRDVQRPAGLSLELLVWFAVVAFAAVARLAVLGSLPLRTADSGRAFAAWQVAQGQLPASWNGDLAQTLTAAFFKLFGAGDGRARLAGALLGTALVAAFWLLRPVAGRVPALLGAIFLAVSPVCVATARSLSPYCAGALFAVLATGLFFSFLKAPRSLPLAYLAFVLGLGFSSDASFIIFLIVALCCCLIEGLWLEDETLARAGRFLRHQPDLWLALLPIWASGFLLSVTHFGIAPERLRSGALSSFSDAFKPATGAPPWSFPLTGLASYEPLLLLAGGVGAVLLALSWRELSLFERFLLYWVIGALLFVLFAPQQEMGQLVLLLAGLALAAGRAFSRWLSQVVWQDLRGACLPAVVAVPPLVYVLFVLEASTRSGAIAANQTAALVLLFLGSVVLLVLAAIWAKRSAPAFLAVCGLLLGLVFALHTMTAVGFHNGDEFLLGPVATSDARALGAELVGIVPDLNGRISLAPLVSDEPNPLSWYARDAGPSVQVEPANEASGGIVQPAGQAVPTSFRVLVAHSTIERSWYPASLDAEGVLRWLLYRQAWGQVNQSSVEFLVGQGSQR
jgi:hypothetical protein